MSDAERERRKEQRRNELLAKKERLQKLKEQNREQQLLSVARQAQDAGPVDLGAITNVQDLLKTLEETSVAPPSKDEGAPQVATAVLSPRKEETPSHSELSKDVALVLPKTAASPKTLSVQLNVLVHDMAPKEVEVYSKGTQTHETATSTEREDEKAERAQTALIAKSHVTERSANLEDSSQPGTLNLDVPKQEASEDRELSPIERKELLQSSEFIQFFNKATRILERAINVGQLDIGVDYAEEENDSSKSEHAGREVVLQTTLFDERWSKHRAITSVAWSPKHSDLVAASYSVNDAGTHDPDGVLAVWSIQNLLQRPEYIFHCQSQVMTILFPEFHPTLIVGGTYSGQIVMWDMRASSVTPVQRTPLSSIGHTHPVYCLGVVGTQNANNLVSVSTDGRMCVWSFDTLSSPIEVLELRNKQSHSTTGSGNVAPTCMAFPANEVNQFFVGSEEGVIYEAYRHGSKSGVHEQFQGHKGPITALDFHPPHGQIDFSDIFVTSSMDWSCKLWSKKNPARPMHSFEDSGDYVYSVRWSPVHPALFASVNGAGSLDLWNLNEDTEAPFLRVSIPGGRALNCLCWSQSGKKLLCGDSAGSLFVYDIGELASPRADEWAKMEDIVSKLNFASFEKQEEQAHTT